MGLKELQANNVTSATPSELDRIRTPEKIYSAGYLDDPIEFSPDQRFEPKSVTKQFPELTDQVQRDFADFLQVDRNSDNPQNLVINMYSVLTDRAAYQKVILPRAAFTQLGVTR